MPSIPLQVWLEPLNSVVADIFNYLPRVALALAVLLVGLALAWLVRSFTNTLFKWFKLDQKLTGIWLFHLWSKSMPRHVLSETAANFAFYLILFFFILVSVRMLGVKISETILATMLEMIPRIFGFVLILLVGFLLAMFFSILVQIVLASSNLPHPKFWGKVIAWGTLGLTVMFSLEPLGAAGAFLTHLILIVFITIGVAVAIAFGLGCKDLAREFFIEMLKGDEKDLKG